MAESTLLRPRKRARYQQRSSVDLTEDSLENLGDNLFHKHRFYWKPDQENSIMIITKARDNHLVVYTRQLVEWLILNRHNGNKGALNVYVDQHLENSNLFGYGQLVSEHPLMRERVKFWTPRLVYSDPKRFNMIILLGGDGTVLFTSWLFQEYMPPIMPFHLGSLSFLTPMPYNEHKKELEALFSGNQSFRATLRMRLSCTIYRYCPQVEQSARQCRKTGCLWTKSESCKWQLLESAWMKKHLPPVEPSEPPEARSRSVTAYSSVPTDTFEVLNEVVVDRGPCAYMASLELFGDDQHLTTVQADGLVIGTPTGSTAYSLSAGGSLVHPCVPSILVTPICAHTLNFRPMLVPHTMTIRVAVPRSSRSSAYCSFDGRNRVELGKGDHVRITYSPYALPTLCSTDTSNDWFTSLQERLLWNQRVKQKSFVVVEQSNEQNAKDTVFACFDGQHRKTNGSQSDDDSGSVSSSGGSSSTSSSSNNTGEKKFELEPWTDEDMDRKNWRVEQT
ncbi:ATP-NAD kinase-like domain-containing protein [Syncephalastrum racemosum]|uniref:ATP-NAD kinase-like domain-containing protein n=1 Tax=Syncephalastrum racemosum TaxID=13706 RepID=A0A1X2HCZ4_SYNRA|nr:ATP-NAD kinase-like domain-containing protein [Syncephalastrum racemosum]